MAGMYLAGKDPKTPLAAPLHADLKRPAADPCSGRHRRDALPNDLTRIAEKLHQAGVDVAGDLAEHSARLSPVRANPVGGT